jgi:c(7)-type cytochrome triheme protein
VKKSSFAIFLMWTLTGVFLWAQAQKAPDTIVFKAKMGDVTYTHKKHVDAAKGDCKVCHDKLFPQSKAPINFKAAMHKKAEAAKSSCAACHVAGGTSFASKGNCQKCHQKGGAKG